MRVSARLGVSGLRLLVAAAAGWTTLWGTGEVLAQEPPERPSSPEPSEEDSPETLEWKGRLEVRKGEGGEAETLEYRIEVGERTYLVVAEGAVANLLHRHRGKFVVVRGQFEKGKEGSFRIRPDGKEGVSAQAPCVLLGTVRAAEGADRGFGLAGDDGVEYRVQDRDARRFRPFEGLHVAVETFVTSDGRVRILDSVESVERWLLPGERDPSSPAEALAGRWEGTLTVMKVPKGIPDAEAGDYAIRFTTDARQKETRGRLMDTYEVVGVRIRKYDPRTRILKFELAYSFGQGSFPVSMTGTFRADWKALEGDWESGFLGGGKFRLAFRDPEGKDRDD